VSARSPRSARGARPLEWRDEPAPLGGHAPADGWTPVEYTHSTHSAPSKRRSGPLRGRPGSVARRRAAAARARRRRLLVADLALGFVLALVVLLVVSGLALAALLALVGLLACGVSLTVERVRRRRSARKS
jgi:hypothetical protein